MAKSLQERFDEKYVEAPSGCWEWIGSKNWDGYGMIGIAGTDRLSWKIRIAHRISYALHVGEIPAGINVLHKCDNPACVNPDHLFLGTQRQNVHDMIAKGRRVQADISGEKNPMSKLSKDDTKTIRHLYFAERRPQNEIADYFHVAQSCISKIVSGKRWLST